MKIVVIGGTGLIGSKLVQKLRADGHDPLAASPATGVDIITGQGLSEALAGAQVVVDVSNAPNWGDAEVMDFFRTSARNIASAETAAGIGHHVALSVVGTDRLQGSGYFRAKLAQEETIKAAAIPSTILRATQFFEFIGGIADTSTHDGTVPLPPLYFQPEAADDVATTLADIAEGAPVNGTVELAGPERFRLDELVQRFLSETNDPRHVVTDVHAPYYGIEVSDERALIPGDNPASALPASRTGSAGPPPARQSPYEPEEVPPGPPGPPAQVTPGEKMSTPIGENTFLHELELNVSTELTLAGTSQPEEEAVDVSMDEWLFDPADAQRYEIGLHNLLGAVEALEDGSGRRPETEGR